MGKGRKPFVDLVGKRFGMLTVVSLAEKDRFCKTRWLCLCDCGKTRVVWAQELTRGKSISCGCTRRKPTAPRFHGESKTKLYQVWRAIKRRCDNSTDCNYRKYGARGISYCSEWKNYIPFREWALSHGFAEGLSIDRIDNEGDYCPENCRWATLIEQNNNKRTNHIITHNGKSMTIAQWSRELGINYPKLRQRLKAENFRGDCLDRQ